MNENKKLIGKRIRNVILFGTNFQHNVPDKEYPVEADEKVFLCCEDGSYFKVLYNRISECQCKELNGKSYQTGKRRTDVTGSFSPIIGKTIVNVSTETEIKQCCSLCYDEEESEPQRIYYDCEFRRTVIESANGMRMYVLTADTDEFFGFRIDTNSEL